MSQRFFVHLIFEGDVRKTRSYKDRKGAVAGVRRWRDKVLPDERRYFAVCQYGIEYLRVRFNPHGGWYETGAWAAEELADG